ncbi:preprotein translocase subunit SecF [Loktanella ponticola]|uniref:Preprotein translocase subunit SecF n=1 Tax=Yoonia ponticola TaxID=1524255 RepID=A0A7W9BIN1_9RHOB|nr:CTP synthetase [Yoonia ponticola]MBB5720947.1 preprotein translocase subunit SecF [Yoonia ponticola]
MFRLATILYAMIATTLAGSLIVAALVMGYDTWMQLIIAACFGAVFAVPASFFVAQAIVSNKK